MPRRERGLNSAIALTAMAAVNAIPYIVAAEPVIHDPITGRKVVTRQAVGARTTADPRREPALPGRPYGTGHTGTLVLRQLLSDPTSNWSATWCTPPTRSGRTPGEIAGVAPAGVRATGSFDEFCALDVDCVTYMATEFGREVDEVIDEMCRLLESGKNVVTTTFIRLVYPKSLPPEMLGKLEKACAAGQSAFMGTGIAPGFTTDALPVYLGSLSEAPRTVRVAERVLQGTYSDPLSFMALGFGTVPAGPATDLPADVWTVHFEGALQMLADGYGWKFESISALPGPCAGR